MEKLRFPSDGFPPFSQFKAIQYLFYILCELSTSVEVAATVVCGCQATQIGSHPSPKVLVSGALLFEISEDQLLKSRGNKDDPNC